LRSANLTRVGLMGERELSPLLGELDLNNRRGYFNFLVKWCDFLPEERKLLSPSEVPVDFADLKSKKKASLENFRGKFNFSVTVDRGNRSSCSVKDGSEIINSSLVTSSVKLLLLFS